jgi:guanylate kinase
MLPPPKDFRGLLLIVAGPTGTGKTTVSERLVDSHPEIERIVTCTTRPPRSREQPGIDYFFLSNQEFDTALARDEFLEWAQVHAWRYGTRKNAVFDRLAQGTDLVVNVDVRGAQAFRKAFAEHPAMRGRLVTVFIMPPDLNTIRARLVARGQDLPEQIERRLKTALFEIEQWADFDYCIVTGSKDRDYARLEGIWMAEKCRVARLSALPLAEARPGSTEDDAHTRSPFPGP